MNANSVDVSATTFDAVVLEGSKKAPVVVDFWAPWCGPCRTLGPILDKLAAEYAGRFVLAKVNSDEEPEISRRYGVRGIPSVKAFRDGRIVDEFTGALPESAVREFLERVMPSPADEMRAEAASVYARTRDAERALELLDRATQLDPGNEDVKVERAAVLADTGRHDEARALIADLRPITQMEDRVTALVARLDLAGGAAAASDRDALARRIAAEENDLDARLQLAHVHVAERDYRSALEQLLEIVTRDRGFREDAGRKTMLKVFELLGNEGELVAEFRRRLARALN